MKLLKFLTFAPLLPICALPIITTSCNKEESKPVSTTVTVTGRNSIEFKLVFDKKYTFNPEELQFDFSGRGDYALGVYDRSHTFNQQSNELTIVAEYGNEGGYIAFTGELKITISIITTDNKTLSFDNTCIFSYHNDYEDIGDLYPLKIVTKDYQGYSGSMVLRKFKEIQN